MVRKEHRLRALQMRVAGDDHAGVSLAELDQRALQVAEQARERVAFAARDEYRRPAVELPDRAVWGGYSWLQSL